MTQNLSSLLAISSRVSAAKKEAPQTAETTRSITHLLDFWQELFFVEIGQQYPVSNIHRKFLKDLLSHYSVDAIKKTMAYYITNHVSIKYIKGYPSIRALYGYREQLFIEVECGPVAKHLRGQTKIKTQEMPEWK